MIGDTPLIEATQTDLDRAMENNLHAVFRGMAGTLAGAELEATPALCRHHAFPGHSMFKGVWRARLTPETADAAIEDTIAWFRARGAPFFMWWTGPESSPADLPARLQAHGLRDLSAGSPLRAATAGAPCMTADLRHLNEAPLGQTPAGFVIREAQTLADAQHFGQVFATSFGLDAAAGQAWVEATEQIGLDRAPWRLYVGLLDDEPVSSCMLCPAAGVAGLYAIGTLPEARGRGLGAAMTLRPLLDARAAGYRYGVLFASSLGLPVYQRLGFRLANATIGRFLWTADSPEIRSR